MTRQNEKTVSGVAQFIKGLGDCTPSEVQKFLGRKDIPAEVLITAALTMLCSREPRGPAPGSDFWQKSLEAIICSGHPLAESALYLIAHQAQNSRIRLEAVRQIGRVAKAKESRELLRSVARDGTVANVHFQNDAVSSDDMKEAAIQAIGDMAEPANEDTEVVLSVVSDQAARTGETALFCAGAEALRSVARPSDLPRILQLVENFNRASMCLRVLSVFSKFDKKNLMTERSRLSVVFARSLEQQPQGQVALDKHILELAQRLSCKELVTAFTDRYSRDMLEHGRGQVCAVCMEAYNPPDDILARAYLAFARTRGNGQTESRCVKGLIRCAKAGMTGEIIRALVHEDCEGYNELLSTGAGLHIAGGMRTYTRSVCDALDSLKEQGKRTSAARTCVVGLLRASLSSSEDMRWLTDLNEFRQGHRPFYGDREEGIASLVRHLKEANLAGSGIHWLASQLVAGKPSDGAIALAECLLAHDDELSHFFIEHVLTVAAACKASAFADDSNLRRFEELAFTRCKEWLQQQLPSVLITNGTPNNYVLDVLRRRHRDFVSRVRETLSVVIKSEDAVCLLRALAEHCGNESVKLLGEQIGFVSERISDVARVRSAALQLLERALVKTNASIASDTRKAVLLRMHAAFEDTLEVRLLAYSMATALADPITISPLRDRQSTDKDPDAQAKIAAALGAIRQKLLVERPAMTDDSGLVVWLGQVGTLADSALSEKVEELLALPHSSHKVLVAALECIEKLPGPKALSAVDRFLLRTSPTGEVLRATRHAKATLSGRQDTKLLDVLARMFPNDAPLMEMDYDKALGARVIRLSRALDDAATQYESGHWDDFVTRLDGACDVLVRHVFENYWHCIGIDQAGGHRMALQDYGNRLKKSEFRNTMPDVQSALQYIHDIRLDATTAHAEDKDGTEKPGIGKEEADLALGHFKAAFVKLVSHLVIPGTQTPL